ncbi:unnamed protein product [Bursaphelenchus xylophilus]|uniref:(pine wood nematode) hypothetical protein n=1 Tax=Bursaphelenchus xylophilus TaxID=6326 RepID=A0A1I7RKL9_BURXY|nr:unnamed protein product [Bursaphelenchus xylophilus]CAG9131234.1 unnamed protein product [Bursaphelenchus xylophilus]
MNLFGIFHKKKHSAAKTPVHTPPCENDEFQMKTSVAAEHSKRAKNANKMEKSRRSKTHSRDSTCVKKNPKEKDKDECDIEEIVKDEKCKNVLREGDLERYILIGRRIIEEEFVKQTEEAARNGERMREKSVAEKKANCPKSDASSKIKAKKKVIKEDKDSIDSKPSSESKEFREPRSGEAKVSKVGSAEAKVSKEGIKPVKKDLSKALPSPQDDGVRRNSEAKDSKGSGVAKVSKIGSIEVREDVKSLKQDRSQVMPSIQDYGAKRIPVFVPNQITPTKSPSYTIEYRLVQGQMVARYVPKQ